MQIILDLQKQKSFASKEILQDLPHLYAVSKQIQDLTKVAVIKLSVESHVGANLGNDKRY